MKTVEKAFFITLIGGSVVLIGVVGSYMPPEPTTGEPVVQNTSMPVSEVPRAVQVPSVQVCDPMLWEHVYHGRFPTAQDRLQVIDPCKTITGTIINAVAEKDGDYHIRVDVADKTLLNDKNISGQHGYLVVETVCTNPVSQRDTLAEGVCNGFSQSFDTNLIGKVVKITGAYITDMEHGWREIHPASQIVPL